MAKYVAIILITEKGIGEGFFRGYFRAKGEACPIINLERQELEKESFWGVIEELIHPGEEVLHLLIPDEKHGILKEAVGKLVEEGFIAKEKETRHFNTLSADVEIHTYDPKSGGTIKSLLTTPQDSVEVIFKHELDETRGKRHKGVNLYAPEHSYELTGEAEIRGDVLPVLELIKKLKDAGLEMKRVRLG